MAQPASASYAPRPTPASSSLYDVLDLILDKGLVVDAYVRVSLVGIELLTVDARIVIASVDTYLRFAEHANRLDLEAKGRSVGLPELVGGGSSSAEGESFSGNIAKKGVDRVAEHLTPGGGGGDSDQQQSSQQNQEDRQG